MEEEELVNGYPYENSDGMRKKTELVKGLIRDATVTAVNKAVTDLEKGNTVLGVLIDLSQASALGTLNVIQEHGQLFMVGEDIAPHLTSTPWYPDLTKDLFDEVNT